MPARFIQISTLTSYPASLLNRDDSGLAKRMRFGGAVRTRVSSQCLKRHWRLAEDDWAVDRVDPELKKAIRSRALYRKCLAEPLVAGGLGGEVVEAILAEFQKSLYGESKKKKAAENDQPNSSLDRKEVIVLGEPEIEFLRQQARRIADQAGGDAKEATKLAKGFLDDKEVKAAFKALTYGAGVDAAMFGRFVSGDPEARVSAAVHVAHALTVHAECSETDYFTAVDDLLTATEGGSGHLGAAELTSGLYYNYIVVDLTLLVSNLTGAPASDWLNQDRTVAARLVRHLIHLVATVSPGAKLGATAPYDHAGLVLAEAGSRQPRTLANAFLDPIPLDGDGLFDRTAGALAGYVAAMDGMYGGHERRWLACRLPKLEIDGAARISLPGLAAEVEKMILDGGSEQ